jgi:hypothetical protein
MKVFLNYISVDSIQINQRFLAYFPMEIGLKLQLTTDMKSDTSKETTLYFSKFNGI